MVRGCALPLAAACTPVAGACCLFNPSFIPWHSFQRRGGAPAQCAMASGYNDVPAPPQLADSELRSGSRYAYELGARALDMRNSVIIGN